MEKPGYLFEVSWEVCNFVGGIHTVIQSKASSVRKKFGENYVCVGPYFSDPSRQKSSFYEEIWDESVYQLILDFRFQRARVQMGRWRIPGEPRVLLVEFSGLFDEKDQIMAGYWEQFGVNSLFGGYDYIEPVLFSHAAGLMIEQISRRLLFPQGKKVLVHAHEWMSGIALLHLKKSVPEIATVFTTHATILGRTLSSRVSDCSISQFLEEKCVEEWAREVGVESKHSVEVVVAREADCFTTVSETTAQECAIILGRKPDFVVHNGLSEVVPNRDLLHPYFKRRMRQRLLAIASEVTGFRYDFNQTLISITSGRYEFRNKGIDLYLDVVLDLREDLRNQSEQRKFLAFVMCPTGHLQRIFSRSPNSFTTHQLSDASHDPVLAQLKSRGQINSQENPVHVVFVPIYLNGADLTLRESYWELLAGADLAVFPSWYEPWGYTPHEAVSLGIPTFTTDCAGFGQWVNRLPGSPKDKGVSVVKPAHLLENVRLFIQSSVQEHSQWSQAALRTSMLSRWDDFVEGYWSAYDFALRQVDGSDRMSPDFFSGHRRNFRFTTQFGSLRQPLIDQLDQRLSLNWNPRIRQLLSQFDPELWCRVNENLRQFIRELDESVIHQILSQPELKNLLERFRPRDEMTVERSRDLDRAYFCMEYGIIEGLKTYSGGLGVLAGDHLKTASDLQVPMAAFGLYYLQCDQSKSGRLGMRLLRDQDGERVLLSIPLSDERLYFQIWTADLGTVRLYLLDSNTFENPAGFRTIADQLYPSESERRIKQEWLLSVGGVELIRKLELPIKVFHMNEGHTAFTVIARTFVLMNESGLTFDEAYDYVRLTTLFTTHTPTSAGHDEFSVEQVTNLIQGLTKEKEMIDRFISLGVVPREPSQSTGLNDRFSMTWLAMRGSSWVNSVSKIHKRVSQKMFNHLYPEIDPQEVPIAHVTNGVHIPSWLAGDWQKLFFESLGEEWPKRTCDHEFWRRLELISLDKILDVKCRLKKGLIGILQKRLSQSLQRSGDRREYPHVLARLDLNTLIMTHAKRIASYKRADLLFQEIDEFSEFIKKSPVPILFILSGKAHPADSGGQEILRKIHQWSLDPKILGSVLFLEEYDLALAKSLLSGSDVWLNTPLRSQEASGTSGMKAAINGTLNLSVADGWWPEAYNGKNGWMLGDGSELWDPCVQGQYDRARVFYLLKNQVLQEFLSPDWAFRIRDSIVSTIPIVSSERMFRDYQERLYGPALKAEKTLKGNQFNQLRQLSIFKRTLLENWHEIQFEWVRLGESNEARIPGSYSSEIMIELKHPGLKMEHLRVEAVLSHRSGSSGRLQESLVSLNCISVEEPDKTHWRLILDRRQPGECSLSFRAAANRFPHLEDSTFELRLIRWL